jgi:hypothetical protein
LGEWNKSVLQGIRDRRPGMWRKIFLVLLLAFSSQISHAASGSNVDDLWQKMKIQQMKDKKKAPEFSLEGISGRRGS